MGSSVSRQKFVDNLVTNLLISVAAIIILVLLILAFLAFLLPKACFWFLCICCSWCYFKYCRQNHPAESYILIFVQISVAVIFFYYAIIPSMSWLLEQALVGLSIVVSLVVLIVPTFVWWVIIVYVVFCVLTRPRPFVLPASVANTFGLTVPNAKVNDLWFNS